MAGGCVWQSGAVGALRSIPVVPLLRLQVWGKRGRRSLLTYR